MIIPPNDTAAPTTPELKDPLTQNGLEQLPGEAAPPSYFPSEQHYFLSEQHAVVAASTSSSNTLAQPTFKSKPTNYLYLFNEHNSMKGEYVIDPCMNIPISLLPPLSLEGSEADRKNLCVHSNNGSVNADIWLSSARDAPLLDSKTPAKRTTLDLGSKNGSVTARVQTTQGAAPFLLTISANNGAVHVTLPRSFNGLLLLTTRHGSVSLTTTLSENCTHLSQVDMTRRYFIGDLSMVDDSDWTGDEVRVDGQHGKIKVKYVDENTSGDDASKGFLNRLFGR